jgi:hypothetical protein
LQTSFRQSTFGVFLLGMRPISRTGHQRSLQNIFGIQLPKERKGLYLYSLNFNNNPNPSSFFGLEKNKSNPRHDKILFPIIDTFKDYLIRSKPHTCKGF